MRPRIETNNAWQEDPVKIRLAIAQHILNKIPEDVVNEHADLIELETRAAEFLFFAASVIDIIKREINDRFQTFDRENVYYIYGFTKHLPDDKDGIKIKQTIFRYFSTPNITERTPMAKSMLWKLQQLRNQASHGCIIAIVENRVRFTFTIRNGKGKTTYKIKETTARPQHYFKRILKKLCAFVVEIRKVTNNDSKYTLDLNDIKIQI
ncbi:MAG: hypothetical protein QXW91_05895 [Candidatus Nitrosotenuis sp.]